MKILPISDFAKTTKSTKKITVSQLRVKLESANAIWPFGWY